MAEKLIHLRITMKLDILVYNAIIEIIVKKPRFIKIFAAIFIINIMNIHPRDLFLINYF